MPRNVKIWICRKWVSSGDEKWLWGTLWLSLTASLPCCLAESFPRTLPAPGIIIRTELRSTLLAFKSLNDLASPYPWSHVAECSWIWHCCEQHCCTQIGPVVPWDFLSFFYVITLMSMLVPVPLPSFFYLSYWPVWTFCFSQSSVACCWPIFRLQSHLWINKY